MGLLGVDPANFIRLRSSDIFCCGTDTSRPIEVLIWKVEDIRSAVPVTSNNLYTEVVYGFNGNMCTRVHNNCGSNAIFKETMQFNFHDNDEEEMQINVRHQQIFGKSRPGRMTLTTSQLKDLEKLCREKGVGQLQWNDDFFVKKELEPRGYIWLRVTSLHDSRSMFGTMMSSYV